MKLFTTMELPVIYSALDERIQHLETLVSSSPDRQLEVEIELSISAKEKIRQLFIEEIGSDKLLF